MVYCSPRDLLMKRRKMSIMQVEDLVSYQLRIGYLDDIADGVGERLLTLNESVLNSTPFKSAGWRSNPSLIKRTHSPPIPTAIASEYFQAPRTAGLTLEDEGDEGGLFGTGAGGDPTGSAPGVKRRRRREPMADDDSSDLSDESDEEPDQRAVQQIKFAKMPLRHRSGSSPIQSSNLRQATTLSPPQPPARRGSHSGLETVQEKARRGTVTSSEVSSENDLEGSAYHRLPNLDRNPARAANGLAKPSSRKTTGSTGVGRRESDLLAEEEEDSDASDLSSAFLGSTDSAPMLNAVESQLKSPRDQVVGTPPRDLARRSTIRKSAIPAPLHILVGELPPRRPMSTIRPVSMMQPRSLLSAALNAKKTKPSLPFDGFASLSGQGDPNPLTLKIYVPFSNRPSTPFEVMIRRTVHEGERGDRPVSVVDLIGLSLWRYNEEKIEPRLPSEKLNVNWWTLRMVEEDGEIDDDFPPLERKKQLTSFTTANNRGRARGNAKVYDIFALSQATADEFEENQKLTPQRAHEESVGDVGDPNDDDEHDEHDEHDGHDDDEKHELTPRSTPKPDPKLLAPKEPRSNPILNPTWRPLAALADMPQPAQPSSAPNATRGEHRFLRIHIHSADAPVQMVTLDVTTETYFAEILDTVCRKKQLDKANHVLKHLNQAGNPVVPLDRTVASIGSVADIGLYRRRFATDGPLTMTGSPSSFSPRPVFFNDVQSWTRGKKRILGMHPLAKEVLKQDELGIGSNYKKYTVWRKQQLRLLSEKIFAIDGEYIHIMPASGGKMLETDGKSTSVHFSNVIGCNASRKHRNNFKLFVYKATESKSYDFVTNSEEHAAEIVREVKKGIAPYRDV